jgi:hypothetical protein
MLCWATARWTSSPTRGQTRFHPGFPHFFPITKRSATARVAQVIDLFGIFWWAVQGSNLRPLPCEGSALPLS